MLPHVWKDHRIRSIHLFPDTWNTLQVLLLNKVRYTEAVHTHWLLSRIPWCNPVHHVLLSHLQVLLRLMLSVRWLHRYRWHLFPSGWWSYRLQWMSYLSVCHRWSTLSVHVRLGTWNRLKGYLSQAERLPTYGQRFPVPHSLPDDIRRLWSHLFRRLVLQEHLRFFRYSLHLPEYLLFYLYGTLLCPVWSLNHLRTGYSWSRFPWCPVPCP